MKAAVAETADAKREYLKWLPRIGVSLMLLDCIVLMLVPSAGVICGIGIMLCAAMLFFFDEFYLLPLAFIFFQEQLILAVGTSAMSYFSYILIFRFIVFDLRRSKLKAWMLPALLVIILFCIFRLPSTSVDILRQSYTDAGEQPPLDSVLLLRTIVGFVGDVLYAVLTAIKLHDSPQTLRKFVSLLPVMVIISGIYGFIAGNIYQDVRYNGSFNDPNYFGFFVNMGIFSVLTLKENIYRSKIVKVVIIAVLYYFLLGAGSITGLLCNLGGLVAYTIFYYRKKAVFMIFVVGLIVAGIVMGAMSIPVIRNLSVVQNLQERIELQYSDIAGSSADYLTSGRTTQWERYSGYIAEGRIDEKLFGSRSMLNGMYEEEFVEEVGGGFGPHQAYLGFIINFGFVGLAMFIAGIVIKIVYFMYRCIVRGQELYLLMSIISAIWIVYGFALDYFFDVRFMLFYFL